MLLDLMHRRFHFARGLAHAARQPVVGAQLVEHRAANPLAGVGLELSALIFLIAAGSIQQADHAGLDQIVEIDASRHFRHELQAEPAHQRCVAGQDLGL
jgi:hypothetical protein